MNKKIFFSMMSIVIALGLAAGGTFAFFSDTGTSTSNVFSSGTLDLQLSNNGSTFLDDVTATFGGINMAPNGSLITGTLHLKNNGSIDANHENITFSNVLTQALTLPGSASTNPMDKFLEITTLTFGGVDKLAGLPDSNINGIKDLDDLETNGLLGLPGIIAGDTKDLVLSVHLHSNTPDDVQGDSVTTSVNVLMTQAP